MVLVGEGCTEEGHDPVAHDLVHRALVAVDGLHHVLENGIEELPRLLGITVGEQLHRTLEVGEEDGDLLALASRAAFEVRIFSARCFGVYESGVANLAVRLVRSGAAHWPQNLFSGGLAVPQDGQVAASGAAHSPQNFMPGRFSCWHRGHCMPRPPNKPDRDTSDRLDEDSLSTDRGQGLRAHWIGRPKVYYRAELTESILRGAERDSHLHPSASREAGRRLMDILLETLGGLVWQMRCSVPELGTT
jgi:hypothetical protein